MFEKVVRRNSNNHWTLINRVEFLIIHPHERYYSLRNILRWNGRFNRLKIACVFEFEFPHLPYYGCAECCKLFQPKNKYLIQKGIWKCPHCDYPNSSNDLGIVYQSKEASDK